MNGNKWNKWLLSQLLLFKKAKKCSILWLLIFRHFIWLKVKPFLESILGNGNLPKRRAFAHLACNTWWAKHNKILFCEALQCSSFLKTCYPRGVCSYWLQRNPGFTNIIRFVWPGSWDCIGSMCLKKIIPCLCLTNLKFNVQNKYL